MLWRDHIVLTALYPLDVIRKRAYQLVSCFFLVFVILGGFAFHAANAQEETDDKALLLNPGFDLEEQLLNHPVLRQSAARSCRAIFVLGQRKAEKRLDLSASLSGERQLASNFRTSNNDPLPSSLRGYNRNYDDIYDMELTARYRLYDWGVSSARVRSEESRLHAERLNYRASLVAVVEDILRVMMQIEAAKSEIVHRQMALEEFAPHVTAIEAQGQAGSIGLAQVREAKLSVLNAEVALQRAERRKAEASTFLVEAQTHLEHAMARQDSLEGRVGYADIRATETGVMLVLHVKTVGAVVQAGAVLTEIVPRDADHVVRACLLPQDVADVVLGQLARISLSAYDVSRYGALEGSVIHIASNTTEEQNVPPYYETLIEIGDKGFPNSNVVPDIVPGMQVTVDIIGGKRTVLDYILSPIQKATAVAFREK